MRAAYPVEQIRRAEQAVMATLPPGTLMQRAAHGLAAACSDLLGRTYGARVLVLAGPGDNGGDALYAGAILARQGAVVTAMPMDPDRVHAGGLAALLRAGGRVVDRVSHADLALDGIVGSGGSPGLRPPGPEVVARLQALGIPVVAVDTPSGIDVDGATLDEPHVCADVTVTFGAHKVGLLVDPAARAAGVVHLVDIGLTGHLGAPAVRATGPWLVAELAGRLVPGPEDHKYSRGVVGVAAGSAAYTGAGLLCVAGASCGLAGMVRFAGDDDVATLVRARFPEVVVGAGRVQAWVVGSGGGGGSEQALRRALDDGVPVVVDADALQHVTAPLDVPLLLTPHAGELARMLDLERAEVERQPLRHVRDAAQRLRATVLLKGNRTLVVAPDGRQFVNTSATPWLATAGSGDVLAGLCGAVTAGCAEPEPDLALAAAAAAWLHGSAATLAGRGGPVIAGDVAAALPSLIQGVLARGDSGDER